MPGSSVFFVGDEQEVRHHAAPLAKRREIRIVNPELVAELASPGDLAIFFSEHFDRFRIAIQQLKHKQVATLYLLDGILEWRNAWENRPDEPACPYTMRPVLSHKAACIGPSQARILDCWGNRGKTEIVGIPRFDQLMPQRQPANSNGVFRLLVMTAKTPGFTEAQIQRTRQSLLDLKSWFQQNQFSCAGKKIQVVWRLTAGLDRELDVENELQELSGLELAQLLTRVDAVISTPSTAMLEAMTMGLPVAALDYHHCPSYLALAWTIDNIDSIGLTVRELINPPESKILFQQTELADALYRPLCVRPSGAGENCPLGSSAQSTATDRLVKLVDEMLRVSKSCIESNQPLCFPAQLLNETTATNVPEFNHHNIFPAASEFACHDLVELQAEWAHARREILKLKRDLNQLQSELDLAHSIFDQIQSHPIAGPVVRLRQKFLDWFVQ